MIGDTARVARPATSDEFGDTAPNRVGATIGVEEEFHVLDPATGDLVPEALTLLAHPQGDHDPEAELLRSAIETATPVCRSLAEVRTEVIASRRALIKAASEHDVAVATAGTVPASGLRSMGVFPKERYRQMAAEYQQLVREQAVCAFQVQVGVPDRDLAVAIVGQVQPWLPVLLAMSASSPFFADTDTGYSSYRTIIWSRWPTAGPVHGFRSADEYDETVRTLVESGIISDPGMVYFDARPSARYPTVELRITDGCPRVDDVVLLTALGRALVVTAADELQRGVTPVTARPELLRAANWRASRSGLSGDLLSPLGGEAVPAIEAVRLLVDHVGPALETNGDADEVRVLLADLLARGTSADRQREALRRRGTLSDVATLLIAETRAGVDDS
ncbi:carboxylate-amine ligase [Cryptosporangium aurantiacum]|uniref:Putative glutamate--cysteine ligase 2 n=1 Tax=Cryptosporangium aurantiacum TaxID=134849 RepID=A0A1M7QC07_9ACTN|nr:glutamate--cysteine ligase [Cryptosporangium aurantiacum]SHN28354.1 carboxylate-amine ligase, YbdK family [Cryptosporangium aurantiacum]